MPFSAKNFAEQDDNILYINKPLARALGQLASIILCRIDFWIRKNEENAQERRKTHYFAGRWWCYNSYQQWEEELDGSARVTIEREFRKLEDLGLILTKMRYTKQGHYAVKWYSIDRQAVEAFMLLWEQRGSPYFKGGKNLANRHFIKAWCERFQTDTISDHFERTTHQVDGHPTQVDVGEDINLMEQYKESGSESSKKIRGAKSGSTVEGQSPQILDEAFPVSDEKSPQPVKAKLTRYEATTWRALEEVIIQASGSTSEGLSDFMRGQLSESFPYPVETGMAIMEPLVDLYDRSGDFRRFVAERIKAHQAFSKKKVPQRSNLIRDIRHVARATNGWLLWQAKNGMDEIQERHEQWLREQKQARQATSPGYIPDFEWMKQEQDEEADMTEASKSTEA